MVVDKQKIPKSLPDTIGGRLPIRPYPSPTIGRCNAPRACLGLPKTPFLSAAMGRAVASVAPERHSLRADGIQ